jgi:glucose-6-phosphate isomerase
MIDEMRSILFTPTATYPELLYSMYRNVAKTGADRSWLHSHAIRYDITLIPPAHPDGEYVKTKGHYPPENPAGTGYLERHEVINGVTDFLLRHNPQSYRIHQNRRSRSLFPGIRPCPSRKKKFIMNRVSIAFVSEYVFYKNQQHGAV